MRILVRTSVKLDIPYVLQFVAASTGPAYSSVLIPEMCKWFGCKTRAAQDALGILISGGWLERVDDQADRRRKIYVLTEKGRADLETIDGWRYMRWARRKRSRTSTRARRRRLASAANL